MLKNIKFIKSYTCNATPVYTYQYSVSDTDVSGSVFSAQEASNDLEASGDYKVALPDGRTQVVSYSVSGPEGAM